MGFPKLNIENTNELYDGVLCDRLKPILNKGCFHHTGKNREKFLNIEMDYGGKYMKYTAKEPVFHCAYAK